MILITGGAGFIGSTIADQLLQSGHSVRVFDNFHRDALTGKSFANHPDLEIVVGDVLDYDALRRAADGITVFIHCAGIAGIDTVVKSPTRTMRVNIVGTANALEVARQIKNLERFIDFSTSEVFGGAAFGAEESSNAITGAVGEARWVYAVSKLAGEHLAHSYWKEFGTPTVTLRPFNIYGPGQVGEGAIHAFVVRALENRDLNIYGEGNQIRAWCYIDDFLRGFSLAMDNPQTIGESFNIGNARAVITIYGLAQTIIRVLDSKSNIVFKPERSADIELRVPRVDKAREILGFEAKVSLEEGIRQTAQYYRNKQRIDAQSD